MKRLMFLLAGLFLLVSWVPVSANVDLTLAVQGIVDGYVNEPLEKQVTLSLSDEHYHFHDLETGDDLSAWFTNLPEGLNARVEEAGETELRVIFTGSAGEALTRMIEVLVPDGHITEYDTDNPIGALSNLPDEKAMYLIEEKQPAAIYDAPATVSGYLKEELSVQYVYIRLINTDPAPEMREAALHLHNGLTGKVVAISEDNVLKVEYTGLPLETDHSLIDITIPAEYVTCSRDLKVPDREDVHFDINARDKEIVVIEKEVVVEKIVREEVEKPVYRFIIPSTGIE